MANAREIADQLRTIAKDGLSDEQYEALKTVQEFRDERDWRHPPYSGRGASFYCPVRFQAYIEKFDIKGVAPACCAKWPRPNDKTFARWEECGVADYTYFALGKMSGLIKIGRSKQPEYRISSLHHEGHEPSEALAILRDGDLELPYHRTFEKWREYGEWFAPHPDILAEIERLTDAP